MKLNDDAHDQFSIMCSVFSSQILLYFYIVAEENNKRRRKIEYQNQIHSHAI